MRQTIPFPRIRLVERRRPLRALDDWRELPLIRITTPASFGKTTLAAAWLGQITAATNEAHVRCMAVAVFRR